MYRLSRFINGHCNSALLISGCQKPKGKDIIRYFLYLSFNFIGLICMYN